MDAAVKDREVTSLRVVMLVNNPCINDSRVIKSAETLAADGWAVTVLCRQHGDLPIAEERAGVRYERIKPLPHDWDRARRRWLHIRMPRRIKSRARRMNQILRRDWSPKAIGKVLFLLAALIPILLMLACKRSYRFCRRQLIMHGKPVARWIRRPFIVYGKPLYRRIRRPIIVYGKPVARWIRRLFVIYFKPLYKRIRRPIIIHGKPLARKIRRQLIIYGTPLQRRIRRWFFTTGKSLSRRYSSIGRVASRRWLLTVSVFRKFYRNQLRRPVIVHGKPLLRRIRRFVIMHGTPLVRKARRPIIIIGKPLQRKSRRFWAIHFRPPLTRARRAFGQFVKTTVRPLYQYAEADEFSNAAVWHAVAIRPTVVHCHDLATLPAGGRIARATGAKLIYDSHELEMHRNATYPRLVKKRRRKLERKYIRQADAVITVSESIADHLRDDYRIPRPIVIMNAPSFDATVQPERHLRADLGLSAQTPLVVYVGSVTINRGIEMTVQALSHASEIHFATVGPRRPATEQEIDQLARALKVRDRVHFVDPVAPDEVVGYIRSADVSILPIQNVCLSYYYCMPNKLLESVFAGIPVAVANLLEMRRFVEAYGCGVVMDETSPEDIAIALREVIANRERYIVGPGPRKHIAERYSWASQAARLRNLYEQFQEELPASQSQAKAA